MRHFICTVREDRAGGGEAVADRTAARRGNDHGRDSACSVGVVVVRDGKIVDRVHIRPSTRERRTWMCYFLIDVRSTVSAS